MLRVCSCIFVMHEITHFCCFQSSDLGHCLTDDLENIALAKKRLETFEMSPVSMVHPVGMFASHEHATDVSCCEPK